jgi:hypothetical protein
MRDNNSGKFIYALVEPGGGERIYKARGIGNGAVYSLIEGQVGAVVSDIQSARVRPERRNLMAHRAVLAHLLEAGTVLPMRFGIIAANSRAVHALLAANAKPIEEQLQRVHDRVEMGLKVSWDVGNIYEYFVCTHPILREMRDRLANEGDSASRDEKIELGRLFDRLVSDERQKHVEQVMEVMQNHCEEVISNPTKKEREIMNLACLIERDGQAEFEKGVFEASKLFNNDFLFDYNGPWAPHNFVDLDLETPAAKKTKKAG